MRASRLAFLLAFTPALNAADQPAPVALPDAVRKAVAGKDLTDSDNLGRRSDRASFRELGGGGSVLVGLEVALSEWFDSEIPHAVRPIYREGGREWTGGAAGNFKSPKVKRTVRVKAKDGYAVGGMWLRTGGGMDRLCLRYMRVKDGHLDPADAYSSDWVGSSDGGSETYVDGGGRPVAGVFANASQDQLRNLGFTFARVPLPAPKKDPAKDPAARKDPPAKKDPTPKEAAKNDAAPAAEDGPPKKSKLELEAEAQKEQAAEDDDGNALLMGAIGFGVVAVPVVFISFLMFGRGDGSRPPHPDERAERPRRRRRPELDDPDEADRRPRRRQPPPLPGEKRGDDEARPRRRPDAAEPHAEAHRPRPEDGPAEEYPRPRRRREPDDEPAPPARPGLAARIKEYVPATTPDAPPAGVNPDEHPPYFLVRATYRARRMRMTRIYVLPGELVVIDAGPGADMNEAAGFVAATVAGGGLVGAMIGGAIGSMMADDQKARGAALQKALDRLNLAGLLEWAKENGNFRARFEDLVGVGVDPALGSFWKGKTRAVGTFRFRDLKRGEFAFEFLLGAEVRGAIELLRRAIGNRLHIGQGWDDVTARYLEGL